MILIILVVVGSLLIFSQQKTPYDETKEEYLGLNNYIDYLEECQAVEGVDKANLSERLRMYPSIPDEDVFDKLEIIKDLKGIKKCDNLQDNFVKYQECEKIIEKCDLITRINFESSAVSGGNTPTYNSITIYNCMNEGYYLSSSSSPPPRIEISRIQLSKEKISELE